MKSIYVFKTTPLWDSRIAQIHSAIIQAVGGRVNMSRYKTDGDDTYVMFYCNPEVDEDGNVLVDYVADIKDLGSVTIDVTEEGPGEVIPMVWVEDIVEAEIET